MRVAGLILAAGAGRRMGHPKAEVIFRGRRLVDRQVDLLRDAGCDPVVVVVGAAHVDVEGAVVVVNQRWADGMGSSLVAGLAHLTDKQAHLAAGAGVELPIGAAAVVLVDQPGLTSAAVRATVGGLVDGVSATRATYDGRPGHPVVFTPTVWPAIMASAVADTGARGWLSDHTSEVQLIPCDGLGDDGDVDTLAELSARERGDAVQLDADSATDRPVAG